LFGVSKFNYFFFLLQICALAVIGLALAEDAKEKTEEKPKKTTEKRGVFGVGLGYGGLYDSGLSSYGSYGGGYGLDHGFHGLSYSEPHVKSVVINKETAYAVPAPYPVKVPHPVAGECHPNHLLE